MSAAKNAPALPALLPDAAPANDNAAVSLPDDPLLTAEQVAPTFKLHVKTVYEMAKQGNLPGVVYLGRALRFKRALVVAWLSHDSPAGRRRR